MHFYSDINDIEKKLKPLLSDLKSGKLISVAEQFYGMYITFRSHEYVSKFAKRKKVEILNHSYKTWIDAYITHGRKYN
jgi:hypothetical protein